MSSDEDKTCCICLQKCYFLESIGQTDKNNVKYIDKLQICCPNKTWDEELNVCNECIEKLDPIFDFIQLCLKSEDYRKTRLQTLLELKVKEEQEASIFECDKCGKQFKLKRSLRLHITRIHLKNYRKKKEILDNEIEESNERSAENLPTASDNVDTNLDIKDETLKHEVDQVKNDSDDENFMSNENNREYSSEEEEEMKPKKQKSFKKGPKRKRKYPLKCEYCDLIFDRMDKYVQHVRSKHTFEKPFKCDQCDAAYYSSHNLSIHQRKHRNEKPYVCTVCGKTFVSSNDLWQHTKIHNAVREYQCSDCYRCYKTHSNLRTHKLQMHLDPSLWKFVCTVCGKKFPLNNNLIKHMRRHEGIKPFGCNLCDKRFVEKIDMQTHLISHSNERLHKCGLCTKEYKKKETLRRHLKVEHDIGNVLIKKPEKKLLCPMCPKVFAFNNKLQRHLLTHTGEKPVKCDYCEKRFRDNYDRNVHYRKEHNIDFIPRSVF